MDMLADFYRRVPNTHYNPHAHAAIEICLKQDNIKFSNLRPVWSSSVLLDPKLQSFEISPVRPDSQRRKLNLP